MNDQQKYPQKVVLWKLRENTPKIASVRYRAHIPGKIIESMDVTSHFIDDQTPLDFGGRVSNLILVKTFGPKDHEWIRFARKSQAKVILDLCDNLFFWETYPPGSLTLPDLQKRREQAHALRETLPLVDEILVPSAYLQEQVLKTVSSMKLGTAVTLMPDPVDGTALSLYSRLSLLGAPKKSRQILWFGNSGVEGIHGLSDLLEIKTALQNLVLKQGFSLKVISDSTEKMRRLEKHLAIPLKYSKWTAQEVLRQLQRSHVVLLPVQKNEFSWAKSDNRAILALSHGVPVVASEGPVYKALESCIGHDFVNDVIAYSENFTKKLSDLRTAQKIISQNYSEKAFRQRWSEVLK